MSCHCQVGSRCQVSPARVRRRACRQARAATLFRRTPLQEILPCLVRRILLHHRPLSNSRFLPSHHSHRPSPPTSTFLRTLCSQSCHPSSRFPVIIKVLPYPIPSLLPPIFPLVLPFSSTTPPPPFYRLARPSSTPCSTNRPPSASYSDSHFPPRRKSRLITAHIGISLYQLFLILSLCPPPPRCRRLTPDPH